MTAIVGVDFTSRPGRSKPITVAEAELRGDVLTVAEVRELTTAAEYAAVLAGLGPATVAVDHPFGLPRAFVAAVGWPEYWTGYVARAAALDRRSYRAVVRGFTAAQPPGRKYLRRATERHLPFAASSLNVVRPPVGLMFHAGAPLLAAADVAVLPSRPHPRPTTVVEGYPAAVVLRLAGRVRYKEVDPADGRPRRAALVAALAGDPCADAYGVRVAVPRGLAARLVADDQGDLLDAVLCAVQAAWTAADPAGRHRVPATADPAEGWIADPLALHGAPLGDGVEPAA
jgi:hypothetical protein